MPVVVTNSIDNTIGAANSGVTNTLTVQNPSNTASSSALINITNGGTTAAFVGTRFAIGSADSFAWVLNGGTPTSFQMIYAANGTVTPTTSTNTPIRGEVATGSGSVTIRSGLNVVSEGERSGGTVNLFLANTNAVAGSNATMNIQTVAGGGFMAFALNGNGYNWIWGNNQPVNQDWQLRAGVNADFTTSTIVMDATQAGAISFPQVPGTTVANQVAVTMNSATGQIGTAAFPGGGGNFVQSVVSSISATTLLSANIPFDNTIPQNTEGTQVLSVSITPNSSTNKLYIYINVNVSINTAGQTGIIALFQDANANASAATVQHSGNAVGDIVNLFMIFEQPAGTTSATTFAVRLGAGSGTCRINGSTSLASGIFGGVQFSSITIYEVST